MRDRSPTTLRPAAGTTSSCPFCKNDTGMAQDRGDGRPFEVQGYRDVSQIGRGASSTVYKGYDPELSRWVAIKVLLTDDPDDPARKRFKREGEITANLGKHPHIVQVLGTGFAASGSPYVVMEFFEQGSIGDRLRTSGAFTLEETLNIGEKIADAVSAAHRAGVLHRDIKPQNILLSEYGPALGDFGIARTSANLEWSQSLDQLTPMHAAPEILLGGTSTAQSDIYALGSTLYAMLAGRPPFAGPPGEAPLRYQVRVVQDAVPPIPRSDLPGPMIEVIERALAKSPADRYHSAAELRDALRSCLHHGAGVVTSSPAVLHDPAAPPVPAQIPPRAPSTPMAVSSSAARPAQPPPAAASISDASDETVTRAGAAATVDPPTASTVFPGPPNKPVPPTTWIASGVAPASSAGPGTAKLDQPTPPPVLGALVPPGSNAQLASATDAQVGDRGELTIQRPISTLDPATPGEPAENAGRPRHLLLLGAALSVVVIAGVAVLLLAGKPLPKIPVTKEYSIPTTDTDKPTTLRLVPTGSGATLQWTAPPGYQGDFLVIEVNGDGRPVGRDKYGKTSVALPELDPTSFTGCLQVRALISARITGEPADDCYATGVPVQSS
jgi:serine/threonine-protein kinase PknK